MKTWFLFLFLTAVTLVQDASAYYGGPGRQVLVPGSQTGGLSPYGYAEYLPSDYVEGSSKKFPILIYLHGLGETGNGTTDLGKVLNNGPPKMVGQGWSFPAIVISPQSAGWWDSSYIDRFVDYLYRTYPAADISRLYITGLSMGGGGTWDYAAAYPDRVAAIIPISPS
jgi:predicted peptidase